MKKALFLLILPLIVTVSCNQEESETEEEKDEVRSEIDDMEDQVEHGNISKACNDDLQEYIDVVDELLALHKREADGEDVSEELEEVNQRAEDLGDEMASHPEVYYSDPDCALAFANANQKYTTYIMENMEDFMSNE